MNKSFSVLLFTVALMFAFVGTASAYQFALIGAVHWTNPEPSGNTYTTEFNTQYTVNYNQVFSSEAACATAKAKLNLSSPLILPPTSQFGSWKKIIVVDCYSVD